MNASHYDKGKPMVELIPPECMGEVGKVMEHGCHKYAPNNWKKGTNWLRYIGSALRHIFAWMTGVDKDHESGINPLAHAICDLMFVLFQDFPDSQFH